MSAPLHVVRAGRSDGAPIVFVHGSAADHTTWTIQLASSLRERFALIAYDRREDAPTVEAQADDLAGLIAAEAGGAAVVVGSSFGAVITLDLARRYPARVRGMVLCEPPLPPSDDAPGAPDGFLETFDRLIAEQSGEAAAEFFLRAVLGDAAYERMPRMFQDRSKALWRAIRTDSRALAAYRPRYAELAAVTTPALLLGGDRSAAYFRPTLDALVRALGAARFEVLAGAGHMMHADAARSFAAMIAAFAEELS